MKLFLVLLWNVIFVSYKPTIQKIISKNDKLYVKNSDTTLHNKNATLHVINQNTNDLVDYLYIKLGHGNKNENVPPEIDSSDLQNFLARKTVMDKKRGFRSELPDKIVNISPPTRN